MDKKEGVLGQEYVKADWLMLALCTLYVDVKTIYF